MRNNQRIIYVDECSINGWDYKTRVWQHSKDPFIHSLPVTKKKSITIIGAIDSLSDQLHYKIADSTN